MTGPGVIAIDRASPIARTSQDAPAAGAAQGPGRLAVLRLVVTRFRNYDRAALALDARHVVLTGDNGAGKTNLLEAVSFLAPGRGLRGARLAEVTRRSGSTAVSGGGGPAEGACEGAGEGAGAGPWGVAATLATPQGAVDIGTGLAAGAEGDKRLVRINGAPAAGSGALGPWVRMLWLTPAMDRLFVEAAGGRRRFLDRVVMGFDPGHAARVTAYERAMRERTRLLAEPRRDRGWLAALEAQMAEHAIAIATARALAVQRLEAAISQGRDTAFPKARVRLDAGFEIAGGEDILALPSVDAEDALRARLEDARGRDAAAGRALEGPHRADLHVHHAARGMAAAACSTGEQKALLIGLVLANARALAGATGAPPLLLLDEVAAHLDARRRAALFDELGHLGAQAWMTGTDTGLFAALGDRAQHFEVANAQIIPRG